MQRRIFLSLRIGSFPLLCQTMSAATSGSGDDTEKRNRVVSRRRVVPSDEDMAELHADTLSSAVPQSPIAAVSIEPMRFGGIGNFRECFDDDEADGVDCPAVAEESPTGPTAEMETEPVADGTPIATPLHFSAAILERQAYFRNCAVEELVETLVSYLRATENIRLVSADEEHVLFPAVMDRLRELNVQQLLDVVECHWARSTLVRYGTLFKDMARDRIAVITTHAAKNAAAQRAASQNALTEAMEMDDVDEKDTSDVYARDSADGGAVDVILMNASEEMNSEAVLRCIVVMGMSAGRRKRDLQFFQAMGIFFAHHINKYKDPHDLQRVLTAFARAKIIPPRGFLALLGRRFAVLNKRTPLGALSSYRAFVNLYRMGYDQMNPFRFLADRIFETIDANLKIEKKRQRVAELRRGTESPLSPSSTPSEGIKKIPCDPSEESPGETNSIEASDIDPDVIAALRARERFRRITELRPSMLTKLLLVLARLGAPHQQYLRPVAAPLLVPALRHFPPPSISRLLRAMRLFRTTDLELIDPFIVHMAAMGPNAPPNDVLELLRIISNADVPVPQGLHLLMELCESVWTAPAAALRPTDMCAIAAALLQVQRKEDIPLDSLAPLTRLMEHFAKRLAALLQLRVVSLTHVDIFSDICRQQQHPDETGSIAELCALRRDVSMTEGDDEYYSVLDIDVRETFHKIILVNDFNTYGQFRPTPGVLQVDFRQALTEVSAFDVLEATHLFAQAFPNAMRPTVERHLSRAILAKLGNTGEEVITEENTIELRPPRDLLLTKADLVKFVGLLQQTPLKRVRESQVVWRFVEHKATKLHLQEIMADAKQRATAAP